MELIDLSGKRFSSLVVIKRAPNVKNKTYWLCKCDCGTIKSICGYSLTKSYKSSKSCGCSHQLNRRPHFKNLVGKKFGKLIALKYERRASESLWLCKCDCGNEKWINARSLKTGMTKSCGCNRSKVTSIRCSTHRLTHSKVYRAWSKMKARCYKKDNNRYKNYGERGISVCDRWTFSFENFLEDMGLPPTNDRRYSIDRIDNNKGYSKENCRWATISQQSQNRTNTRLITYKNETHCMAEWARRFGIKPNLFRERLRRGITMEELEA